MEKQNTPNPSPVLKANSKNTIVIILLIIFTALISGSLVYFYQKSQLNLLQQEILLLKDQVNQKPSSSPSLSQPTPTPSSPISYSLETPDIEVTQETQPFDYTVKSLESLAAECGSTHQTGYLENLVKKYSDTQKLIYKFEYQAIRQDNTIYTLTVIPNVTNYQTLEELKKDFDQCFAGGDAYPLLLNQNWLVFENSCGTGFDNGSGRPRGCDIAKEDVAKTLRLN